MRFLHWCQRMNRASPFYVFQCLSPGYERGIQQSSRWASGGSTFGLEDTATLSVARQPVKYLLYTKFYCIWSALLMQFSIDGATTNSDPHFCVFRYAWQCVCSLTSRSHACSTAGGPCSSRSRWARLDTRRTSRRFRARSARSRAAEIGRRWETRSPHTTPPLLCTRDLDGAHQCVDGRQKQVRSQAVGPWVQALPMQPSQPGQMFMDVPAWWF